MFLIFTSRDRPRRIKAVADVFGTVAFADWLLIYSGQQIAQE